MATYHGKNGVVKIGVNAVAQITEFNVEEGVATADNTAMGQSAETHLVGITNWSGSLSCFYDDTDVNGQQGLVIGAAVTPIFYLLGTASGRKNKTGLCTIEKIISNSSKEGVVTKAFTVKGNGPLTEGTNP